MVVFKEMVARSDTPWIVSGVGGEIYWGNIAFLRFIGYSLHEFTRRENPVMWTDITVKDDNLDADLAEANRCASGQTERYTVRKNYIPKNAAPVFVELDVFRYPIKGEFEFFLVEVTPLQNGHARMAKSFEDLAKQQLVQNVEIGNRIASLADALESNNETPWKRIGAWMVRNPKWGVPIFILFLWLIFGDPLIDSAKQVAEAIKSATE